MRTQQEILERWVACEDDFLGFETGEYVRALPSEALEPHRGGRIQEDADLLSHIPDLNNGDALAKQMHEYMDFAWEKANGCRGISASRSMSHYKAWLWMVGEDQFEDIERYQFYGKDELVRICEFLGLDPSKWDDGIRSNEEY